MNRIGAIVALIVAVAGFSLVYCPAAWSAAIAAVGALLITASTKARRESAKLILVNLAAVSIALAAFEGYLYHQAQLGDGTRIEGTIVEDFTSPDDVLGYRPKKGSRVTARKLHGDTVIYDVVYTISADGLRVAPPAVSNPPARCVVFFGDSVTFGEGVNDEQTYPYVVGTKSAGTTGVYNFAFSGYGPHQMLAALQANLLAPIVPSTCAHVVHLAILEHVPRVAGLASWDRHGPRFRLGADGRPWRDGNFDTPPRVMDRAQLPGWTVKAWQQFRTWQMLFGRGRKLNAADLALYISVVRESARIVRERYAGSRFEVILWDGRDDSRLETIERALQADGVRVHRLTRIIPDFAQNASAYLLAPRDGHPNPAVHRRLAEYIHALITSRTLH